MVYEAQKSGDIGSDLSPHEIAEFIISSWHGALIRMKVEQNARALEQHRDLLFKTLLRPVNQT